MNEFEFPRGAEVVRLFFYIKARDTMPNSKLDTLLPVRSRPRSTPKRSCRELLDQIWRYNPSTAKLLRESASDEEGRERLYAYFSSLKKIYDAEEETIHSLDWDIAMECLQVAKTVISVRSQRLTGFNLIQLLRELAKPETRDRALLQVQPAFLMDLERLWAGCRSRSGIYRGQRPPEYSQSEGREAALARSDDLDRMAQRVQRGIRRYPTGLEKTSIQTRSANRQRIMRSRGVTLKEWNDWQWQVRQVIRTADDLAKLIRISSKERRAIEAAEMTNIPFGITPYYVHLMDPDSSGKRDRAIRFQVIPPPEYVERLSKGRRQREKSLDFMLERDTSPCELVTRRYPLICILKPYNTCAQICVYCQRNWEVEGCLDPRAMASAEQIETAMRYINDHPGLKEVLITGGDPLILSDSRLKIILDRLAAIPHVERIRIGTRTPVVLPMRITDELADLLASYRILGRRDICVVTHFEHAYEVTPDAAQAVDRLKKRGLNIYNQVVFTFANSRRFEMVALRRVLGLIGVEPYYTFSPKGKEETNWYRIPIARMQQARKEEARLTPGTWRTDDTVFNVPRLGKNYLNRQQDHSVIAILANGSRVYEFHPWEKKLAMADTFLHADIPIHEYLQRLEADGENPADYDSIWYYF